MATLTPTDIADLVQATQDELGEMKVTDLSGDLQEYTVFPELMRKNRVTFQGGTQIKWNAMIDDAGTAANVGMMQTDNYTRQDVLDQCTAPWRGTNVNYSFDMFEVTLNSGKRKLLDMVKTLRTSAMISLAKKMETNFWGAPSSSSDVLTPWGVDLWVTKNATQGFNGGNLSGFSDTAGIDASAQTRWRNWTDQYTNVTRSDLIRKWREACTKTRLKPPVAISQYDTGMVYGYYTNYDVIGPLEEAVEDKNDNLGNDIASKDGMTLFRRVPVTYVAELDSDSQDPVYGINWGVFKVCFADGWFMKEFPARQSPTQHTVMVVDIDNKYNFICYNRRKNFIVNTA